MDVFICQFAPEFLLQNIGNRMNNKINNLHWRINNTKFIHNFWECGFKKFIIEFDDNLLFPFSIINAFNAFRDGFIEFCHNISFAFRNLLVQCINHTLHRHRNGIIFDERIIFKQSFKNGLCDNVLRKHFNCFICRNSRI
ncbi:hypothetical protein SDC9_205481 [bioreactor metagenome]|uniref:Uncharacterized protein n=1 Tax=bioreactor metagenome TaxID=1076179 RepID=A0A645J309_9ZZZZ